MSVNDDRSLLEIFRRLDSNAKSVSYFSGLAADWHSLLAFNPIAKYSVTDLSDITELNRFLQAHEKHLVTGYVSYDLGQDLHGISSRHESLLPLLTFYAYDNYLMGQKDEIVTHGTDSNWQQYLSERMTTDLAAPTEVNLQLEPTITEDRYRSGFDKIQRYIRDGDIYQINYTFPLVAKTDVSSRDLFAHYFQHKPVAYAAYMETSQADILSLSPESFYHEKNNVITTRPIKGTRPRGIDAAQDNALREQLLDSKKEQAELFMIVDLLRNDLGKVCTTGSVEVTRTKEVTALPNVWHTYSEVQGQRQTDISSAEALLSMLPGGSITGCPKIRAMEIIDELEVQRRGIYTGSLGYRLPDGEMAFNIAIRTMVKQAQIITLGVGGGITIKSDCDDEYQEALAKSNFFRQL